MTFIPKVIVIDTYSISKREKIVDGKKEYIHNTLDTYPISFTKYLAIKDLFREENILNHQMEFLFNFSLYHSRWNKLTEDDFSINNEYEKGAESRITIAIPQKMSNFNDVDIYKDKETINMDIVNYNTDCYDKDSHLNPSGARKVTDYLGKYIMENYDILDQRENDEYKFWYDDYDEYINLKIENLEKNKTNLNNYLMLLYGEDDIKCEIKISSSKEINEGTMLYELLKNLNNNYQIDDTEFQENKDKTIKITTWNNRTGEAIDTVWF